MKLPIPNEILITNGSDPNLICKQCKLCFASLNDLALHQLEIYKETPSTENSSPVTECSITYEDEKFNRSSYACSECLKPFSSEKGLNQHVGKIHNFTKRSFKCPICHKKFRDQSALKFHTRQVHEKSTRVSCSECDQIFYSKYVMEKHLTKCIGKEIVTN